MKRAGLCFATAEECPSESLRPDLVGCLAYKTEGGSLSLKVSSLEGEKKYPPDALHPTMGIFFIKAPITTSSRRGTELERKWLGAKECELPADQASLRATRRTWSLGSSGFLKATCVPEEARSLDSCVELCCSLHYKPRIKPAGSGGFPGGAVVKNPPANAGDTGSSPGPGRSLMPRSN